MPLQITDDDQSDSSSSSDESLAPVAAIGYTYKDEASVETGSSDEESAVTFDSPFNAASTPLSSDRSETPTGAEQWTNTIKLEANDLGHASIRPSQLRYPKSQYQNFVPSIPVCPEGYAVADLLEELGLPSLYLPKRKPRNAAGDDFVEFEVSDFVIYRSEKNRYHAYELWTLQDLASKNSFTELLFDGVLRAGGVQRFVQGVPFDLCSIGNYGEDIHDVGDDIWIKSTFLANSNIYYRLKTPATEYARFYHEFLWSANLAKHFVDFCQWATHRERKVSVFNFRTDFSRWLQKRHGTSPSFQSWYQEYQNDDFRHAVAANIHFLFKESIGVDGSLRKHPIWNELLEQNIVPVQELKQSKTVVTPYVYDCFEHLRFGHLLKPVTPKDLQQLPNMVEALKPEKSESTSIRAPYKNIYTEREREHMIKTIRIGYVISVTKDGEDSVWKDETTRWKAADDCWYIYVQGIHESKRGKLSFEGLWLYKSSDTCCAKMKYPFPNELFLSDNCTCSRGRIQEDDVLDRVDVEWYGSPSTSQGRLFVRQTYLENDKFESLKDDHKTCQHLQPKASPVPAKQKFPIGQTVLASPSEQNPKHSLEPYEIVAYAEDGSKTLVVLKQLLRRSEIPGQEDCRPNELVYSDRIFKLDARKIECTCLVRFYSEADVATHSIPTPYDRDGAGNAFYITTRLVEREGHELEPIQINIPRTLIQGSDPTHKPPRKLLRGLDLYCGGGNFGRGLEEGGALHNEWAVDYAKTPMHSYYANLKDPSSTRLFCGSVDDQLYQALNGNPKRSKLIPMPGEVDFISAGSPCQGFSSLNSSKNNEKGLKNQSLVASVAAYIDFYRPKYGLLENVMTMARKGLGRDEDVLSQLICAIVGMGYQLQLFVLDAWSTGSPQSRSRLFVSFAAPGYPTLEHPQLSHSHPAHVASRGLGKLANGESFGHRIHCPTPFEYVTAYEATKDLPDIGDGQTGQCISHPDHIMPIMPSAILRSQMAVIPTRPRGSKFVSAWNEGHGVMTESQRDLFPSLTLSGKMRQCVQKTSNAWGRVHPHRLFPTIVVRIYPMDARMGTCMHWDQQRMMTVMEARRAQSFPDHEVLVGSPADKWKIIGNSVSRTVSLALGLSLRNAWLKCPLGDEPKMVQTTTTVNLPSTQSNSIREKSRVAQPSSLRHDPILPGHQQSQRESNVGRSLKPLPRPSVIGLAEVTGRRDQRASLGEPRMSRESKVLPWSNPLKRRHTDFQEMRILPPGIGHRAQNGHSARSSMPTPLIDSSERSKVAGWTRVPVPPILSISALRERLSNALDKQIARQNGSEDGETTGSADDQDDVDDSVLNSAIAKLEKRFPRMDTRPSTGSVSPLNKERPKRRLVIELDSFFEGERSTDSDNSTGQLRIPPPPRKYIRTSGGKIVAKAQTNGLVHRAGYD